MPTHLASEGPIATPAVAKPRFGSGSIGVRVLLDEAQVLAVCAQGGTILQPLIGPLPAVPEVSAGWPLFWQLPIARQGGVQGLILPDGSVGPALTFEVIHAAGKVERQRSVEDDELVAVGQGYLRALAGAGWRGPANIACIHSGVEWLCLELNGRFTGGTAARTALGFDEVGIAINAWAGSEVVPARLHTGERQVLMQPATVGLVEAHVDSFRRTGRWP